MIKFQEIKDIHPNGSIFIGENKGKIKGKRISLHAEAMSWHEDFIDVAKRVLTAENRTADVTKHPEMQELYNDITDLLEQVGFGKFTVKQADFNKATDVDSHHRMLYVPCASPDCIDLDIQTGEKGIFKLPLNEGVFVIMPSNSGIRIHAPANKMFLCLCMGLEKVI
tara:strand:+ start:39 stop:539 length:501 start_codon:yes stop_codon:yes gene_type:complete